MRITGESSLEAKVFEVTLDKVVFSVFFHLQPENTVTTADKKTDKKICKNLFTVIFYILPLFSSKIN
jgi:hypothetical protein